MRGWGSGGGLKTDIKALLSGVLQAVYNAETSMP